MAVSKAKQLKLHEVNVHMGLFDFGVRFLVGDFDATAKYVAWFWEDEDAEAFANDSNIGYLPRGKCFYRTGFVPIIWISKVPESPREYATLSHEIIHALFHLFDWANVPIDNSTEEVFAHAEAHLVNGFLKKIKAVTKSDKLSPTVKVTQV